MNNIKNELVLMTTYYRIQIIPQYQDIYFNYY